MKILLHVGTDSNPALVSTEAVVEIDSRYAVFLLRRRNLFEALKAYEPDLKDMYFWSRECSFVGDAWAASRADGTHTEEWVGVQLGRLNPGPDLGEDYEILPVGFVPSFVADRIDCEQVVISEEGVSYTGQRPGGDQIRTTWVPWSAIEKAANGEYGVDGENAPVLSAERIPVWELGLDATLQLPLTKARDIFAVQRFWAQALEVQDSPLSPVIDWGHLASERIAEGRWVSHLRVLLKTVDPLAWFNSLWHQSDEIEHIKLRFEPIQCQLPAGYQKGQIFNSQACEGVVVGGEYVCVPCFKKLNSSALHQYMICNGLSFYGSVCHWLFESPTPEDA